MLVDLSQIERQLAGASQAEAKQIRDKAEAIRVYARQQKNCKHIEREATIIRLRAERQLGKLIKPRAGNPNCSPGGQLPEGITRKQSSAWQQIAKLPAKAFEQYLQSSNPSTKGALRLAVQHRRERENANGPDTGGNILTGDMSQLHSRLEDGSVDLFLSDPPYAELDCYTQLAELAAAKLKPGGLCVAYTGTLYLPEVMQRMGDHLTYWWTVSLTLKRTGQVNARRLTYGWKPIVIYCNGKPDHAWFVDRLHGGGFAKDAHDWQQHESESEYLIEKLTRPGDLVVDPFLGSGTTLAAAKALGRNYLGCEIDGNTARGARRRLAA